MKKEILGKLNIKRLLHAALDMFLALMCQTMFFSSIKLFGVYPMVLPAVAVAVGMFQGASWGAIFALVMGFFADMAYIDSTITYTVMFPALAFAAGFVAQFYINRRFFAYMGAAFAALLITAVVQMLKTIAMDQWAFSMIPTIVIQTLWSMPAAAVAYYPSAKWIR